MKIKLFILALLTLPVVSCTQEIDIAEPAPAEQEEKKVTISATLSPKTRVSYDGMGTLAWETGDQLLLAGYDGNMYKGSSTFTYVANSGNKFSGEAIDGATTYKAYYAATFTLDGSGNVQLPDNFWEQTQAGNSSTAHLATKLLLSDTDANPLTQSFTLDSPCSIIKFDLSGIPADVGALDTLIWTVETASGPKSMKLKVTDVTFSASVTSLTAFLAFDPAVMDIKTNGEFKITLVGERTCKWSTSSTNGKDYLAKHRYTATVDSEWALMPQFKFTINLTGATTYKIYQKSAAPIPANLEIDWGDGTAITKVSKNSTPGTNFASHNYTSAGSRTITIYSDQADPSVKQMPQITFYSLNPNVGNLLTAVLTPFPNMEATDFKECFYKCDQLTSISKDLFRYNTQATTFYRCFFECKELTSVPEDLFKYNTQATNFYRCFHSCWKLVLIKGIFPDPSENADFFVGRTMNFDRCFYNVGFYTTAGTAPELWKFTGGGNGGATTWTTYQCFKGANLTNPDIPTGWK